MVAEAQAYKARVVNLAAGEAKSFLALYETYKRAEDVTAWRLYLDGIDEVLKKAGKVIVTSSISGTPGIVPYMSITDPAPAPLAPALGSPR